MAIGTTVNLSVVDRWLIVAKITPIPDTAPEEEATGAARIYPRVRSILANHLYEAARETPNAM